MILSPDDLTRTVRTKIHVCTCGCWVWTGAVNSKGYASAKIRGRVVAVHRYTYSLRFDDLDDDLTIDHLCDRHRRCVNPEHFEQISRSENSTRANQRRWHTEVDRSQCDWSESGPTSPPSAPADPHTYRTSDTPTQGEPS